VVTSIDPEALEPASALRVLHLNDIAWVGSALVDALRQAGADAELLVPPRPGVGSPGPLRPLLLPMRLLALAGIALQARWRGPDLVHLHYARHGWVAPLLDRPYVLHCHGTDVRDTTPGRGWGRVVEPAMRRAAAVLYATPDLAGAMAAYRPDALFMPNPIPIPDVAAVAPARTDVLLGVRLDAGKGAADIERLMAELLRVRPATTVTLVSHGAQADRLRRRLGAAATLAAPVPHASMPKLLAPHRVAVGQMHVGALGNYELEAMAAGLPTAARFRFPDAYPEAPPVIDGDDPAGVARELAMLLDDPDALRARGAASRQWVATHHAPPRIAERVLALYREIMARRDAT
jgi:hypothetical protein